MEIFFSVLLYLGIFFVSYYFFKVADQTKRNTRWYFISVFIAIVIPAFIAGARGINIGSDTKGYGYNVFNLCCSCRGLNPMKVYSLLYSEEAPMELFYVILQFIISRFTHNIFWSLFLVSFISLLFVYLAVKYLSKYININISFTMLIFLILFYNESLNLMRQTLGFSIAIFGFSLFVDKKYFKSILVYLMAYLFHRMSLITLIFIALYLLLKRVKMKKQFYFSILAFSVITLLVIKPLTIGLIDLGLLSTHYLGYVESGYIGVYFNGLTIRAPLLYILLRNYKKIINGDLLSETFFAVFIIELVLINTIYLSPYATRICSYFLYTKIFLIGRVQGSTKTSKNIFYGKIPYYNFFLLCYSLMWWFYYSVYMGINETLPYYFGAFK